MKQHKWHKEIKAWADGAEIECRSITHNGAWGEWDETPIDWNDEEFEFRIKPQPKEPQYVYVYHNANGIVNIIDFKIIEDGLLFDKYIGKIKLEQDDE